MDALKEVFRDPAPKDTVCFYKQIYDARDNQYIVLRLDKAQGDRPFHVRVTCIRNSEDPSQNTSKVFAVHNYAYSNADYWSLFYSEYQDVPNHMFTYFPVNRDETGLGTLMLAYPVELPDGVKAWWAKTISNKTLYVQALDTQVIPAFTPVLLTYEGTGPLYLLHYEGDKPGAATDYENNLFKGSVDPGGHKMTSSEMMSNFFTLDKGNDNLMGFYPYHPKNNTLPSYTAWLALSDIPGGNELLISFDEPPTGVESVSGFKFQVSGSGWYDMFGRKLNGKPTQPGMYIHDGKAVVIE